MRFLLPDDFRERHCPLQAHRRVNPRDDKANGENWRRDRRPRRLADWVGMSRSLDVMLQRKVNSCALGSIN